MTAKKINARLSLLTSLLIFFHVGSTAYHYLTLHYIPILKKLSTHPFMLSVCLHAILAMSIVFFSSDGTKLEKYPKQNVETILQRASALLILPLLILHINTLGLLNKCADSGKWPLFVLLLIFQPVFYATVFTHVAVSVSRALITLGRISSLETKKKVDRGVRILCAVFFTAASFAVIKGQLAMFMSAGGVV